MTPFSSQMRRAVRCPEIRRVSVPLVCFKDDDSLLHVGVAVNAFTLDWITKVLALSFVVNGTQASGFVHCD